MRPKKIQAINAAIELTPQYAEWIIEIQKTDGRFYISNEVHQIQNYTGQYVLIYDDERKINRSLALWLYGDEGFKEFTSDLDKLSPEEQQARLDDIANTENNELLQAISSIEFPTTPEEWQAQKDKIDLLPEDERKIAEKQGLYFWCFTFSSFFNTLSLMVHGAKLTALVPQALTGDDEAYLKAIQIDRMLLLHHPYFRERKFKAQNEGQTVFLDKIAYREANPILRSRIRYPALYMLFGILDSYQWLSDLKHREILDICDQANLDRFQNRIEDVNSLTRRLNEYRQLQKTGGVSMHSN